jgi:hypothetical protein
METAAPANPTGESLSAEGAGSGAFSIPNILLELGVLGITAAGFIYFRLAYLKRELPQERSFDLLLLLFTFALPQLTAFILDSLKKLGLSEVTIPTDAASVTQLNTYTMTLMGVILVTLFAITILLGQLWNREWWKYGALYWGVFTLLYTTVFTNAAGFFTGIVGSLGYWLVQQEVERGSQPEYYYLLIQIPIYEFLTAIGSLVAVGLGLKKLLGRKPAAIETEAEAGVEAEVPVEAPAESDDSSFGTFFSLLVFWVVTSIAALTIAGERMPWLTYHMAWPMVLLTGWGVGQIIEGASEKLKEGIPWQRTALSLFITGVFLLAAFNTVRSSLQRDTSLPGSGTRPTAGNLRLPVPIHYHGPFGRAACLSNEGGPDQPRRSGGVRPCHHPPRRDGYQRRIHAERVFDPGSRHGSKPRDISIRCRAGGVDRQPHRA